MKFAASTLFAACLLCAMPGAQAEGYAAALKAKRFQEAERLANAALAVNPRDPLALHAKVDALLGMGPASRLDEATRLAEQCIAANPKQSLCHEALGNVLGTKAINAGIFSAMGYAGKICDAFSTAIALDPSNMAARFALLQYFLNAPAIVGGGTGKAQELAAATGKLHADAGKLMLVQIDAKAEQATKAEAALRKLAAPDSDVLAEHQRDAWWSVGQLYVQGKQFADAERAFSALQTRFPQSELGPYGMARNLQEQGKHKESLVFFNQALKLDERAFIHYRMAQALQAGNDKAKAIAAYEAALRGKPALNDKQRSDAQAQLKQLKS